MSKIRTVDAKTDAPARKVVTRSPHRSVGIMACSWIQERGIEYESQLERRFLQLALVFPYIKEIRHQPFTIDYEDGGEPREYTPDFLCRFKDDSAIVIEVKPEQYVKENRKKFDAAKAVLQSSSIAFGVCTDRHIDKDKGCHTKNSALLLRYARGSASDIARTHCVKVIQQHRGAVSLGSLVSNMHVSHADVFHLIGRGVLSIPSLNELGDETAISLPIPEIQNASLLFKCLSSLFQLD